MKKIILVFALWFSIVSLFAQKNRYIVSYGSGGGVTGIFITYTLDSKDGEIIKSQSNNKNKERMAMLKKKQVKEISKDIKAANFATIKVNTPGNMSYFVNVTIDGKEYKTTWAAGEPSSSSGNAALDALYKKLMGLVQKK